MKICNLYPDQVSIDTGAPTNYRPSGYSEVESKNGIGIQIMIIISNAPRQ